MSLSTVSTEDLRRLRDLVVSRVVLSPLTEIALSANGLGSVTNRLLSALAFDSTRDLVRSLELVLDERARLQRAPIELVWTGPDTTAPETRDTAVVLGELFRRAQRRVLLAGYLFYSQGGTILRPLHEALVRGVEARLFMHIKPPAPDSQQSISDEYVAGRLREFIHWNWPFGAPYPAFFYDPRTIQSDPETLLHAKCAVADGRLALVTSANFTTHGQHRHIEVGALIDDEVFASRLERQFNGLVSEGLLREIRISDRAE